MPSVCNSLYFGRYFSGIIINCLHTFCLHCKTSKNKSHVPNLIFDPIQDFFFPFLHCIFPLNTRYYSKLWVYLLDHHIWRSAMFNYYLGIRDKLFIHHIRTIKTILLSYLIDPIQNQVSVNEKKRVDCRFHRPSKRIYVSRTKWEHLPSYQCTKYKGIYKNCLALVCKPDSAIKPTTTMCLFMDSTGGNFQID